MASGKGSVHASRRIRMGQRGDATLVGAARPSSLLYVHGERATAQERNLKPEPQVRNASHQEPTFSLDLEITKYRIRLYHHCHHGAFRVTRS